ncbi:MAG: hypothetical protein FJX67_08430 [Alphaproteobacteria bacterium]|nr:hypothetical protein [Alphaproteobacteria bacterium]
MTGLYVVKYEVKRLDEELARLNRQILDDQSAIHVLNAEWAYLNQLDRLEALGRRLLALEPVKPDRIVSFGDLPPPRPATAEDEARRLATVGRVP